MKYLLSLFFAFSFITVRAQKDQVEKIWYNQEKSSKIQIYKANDGKFYGKIVWLKVVNDEHGKPRTDNKNPNASLQNQPVNGLIILKGFTGTSDTNVYENGTIYDPNNGKTYCGKITFKGSELNLRGFICSFSLLGRFSTWTLAD